MKFLGFQDRPEDFNPVSMRMEMQAMMGKFGKI
jgi:hypothetical protein